MGYCAIMIYMGDYPSERHFMDIDLTDQIFRGPLKYVSRNFRLFMIFMIY